MPNPLNISNIPAPRVEFIDPRTGLMAREWYRFFFNLFNLTGGGKNDTSLSDLQVGPPPINQLLGELGIVYDQAQLASMMVQYEQSVRNIINEIETAPAMPQLGTMAPLQQDNLPWLTFDNTPENVPPNAGTIYWDNGEGTLDVELKGGNVTCKIGVQEYVRAYNKTLLTMTKGQIVYISGAQGNRVAVKLAQADGDANSAHTIGIVAETITAGGEGFVQISGPIYKVDTLGTIAGDTVYLSPTIAGDWTTTKPVAPDHLVIIGFIERVHASVGSIFIKIDNGYELDELHNVKITSVANNDLLQYDSAGPYWKNVAPSSVSVGSATNLAGGVAGSLPYQSATSSTTFLGIGAADYVLTSTGTAPTWTLNTGTGSVVRATSPTLVTPILGTPQSGSLTLCTGLPITTGVSGLGANVATFLATPSSANLFSAMADETGTGLLVFGTSPTIATPTITTSATVPLLIGGTSTTSTLVLRSTSGVGTTGADIIFQTGNNGATEAMRVLNSGVLLVNTATATNNARRNQKLAIVSTGSGNYGGSAFTTYGGTAADICSLVELQRSRGTTDGSLTAVTVNDVLGYLMWRGADGSAFQNAAAIRADVDSTPGLNDMPGRLVFLTTRDNTTTLTERMRIDSAGNVGIGINSPARILHIASANPSAFFDRSGGNPGTIGFRSSRGTLTAPTQTLANDQLGAFSGFGYTNAGAYSAAGVAQIFFAAAEAFTATAQGAYMYFTTTPTGSTTAAERLRIDATGNVGIGTITNLSTLTVNGSFASKSPSTVNAATYSVAATDGSLRFTTTNCTVTLPAAASFPGRILYLNTITANSVTSAASNVIPLGSDTAGTAILAATAGKFAMLQSNGTNWITMLAN